MAVADAPEHQRQRRTSLGWRVAAAFAQRREASILVVAIGLAVYFSLSSSAFYDRDNIKNMAESAAPIALISAGEVMLLISGEIDLAVGRVFALSPIIMYTVSSPEKHGQSLWLGAFIGLLAAAAVGLTNGVITTYLRVPSFITTLGMLFFLNGINLRLSGGFQISTPGAEGSTFHDVTGGYGLFFNSEFYWAIILVLLMQLLLSRTRWGLHTIATGGNLVGASESGVNVRWIKIGNFVLANVLAGLAGILDSERITSIQPLQGGADIMFLAVAAAVIGGTSLLGGSGTVIGSFFGVLVLIILQNGFNILGVNAFNFDLIIGLAILISMVLNVQIARLKNLGRLQ
jgi:simple sugar transport system permease protein